MPSSLANVAATALAVLDETVERLARSVPPPLMVRLIGGRVAFRYMEQSLQQAIVLKTVRLVSATRALWTLADAGLLMDAGALMRILDDVGGDIQFLAGPLANHIDPEPRHAKFLEEFFQEEFDHPDAIKSTQKRDRVGRKEIRAYIARTYHGEDVSRAVDVYETIDAAYSGYVHGAGVHVLDAFDGTTFVYRIGPGNRLLNAIVQQVPFYIHRSLMDAHLACTAVGANQQASVLYAYITATFSDTSDVL